jgi:hypothetical protein
MSDLMVQTELFEALTANQQQLLSGGCRDSEDYEYKDGYSGGGRKRPGKGPDGFGKGLDGGQEDYLKVPIILKGAIFVPESR